MYPILFTIGKLSVYTHGLMMAVGGLFGGLAIFYMAKKQHLRTDFILDICVYALLAGLFGSRILYIILYFNEFSSFEEMLYIWHGGLVSYGGIAGGLLVSLLILKIKKEPVLKWFDIGIIGLMVGWAFGRVGCFLNGDSYGLWSISKLSIWGRIPTQLFESIWSLIASFLLFYFGLKIKEQKKLPDGIIFFGGLGLYSIGRFVIDFWRDEPVTVWFLKTGQIGSALVLIFAVLSISYLFGKERKPNGSN
ncbi:MAG: prolipoprotein diacylglyceryl transferase, phosphatidylglycerol:prolipoprotein diacylglycerol transferase [Berkelbacteria bacterium GW2011_GWE1_39_12]|uniref:Phosphatidylglycerol--prolipoprotein diacylglyceryl transferase n=1 Tax=Berkelbacteria bacterium GW2011_GWE1_39_12 TaxID=1618337 RepID=A0A0G4B3R5_9BACT|nr:MAG: prolipoprotein diacylglyceryl transferase, phosphatidylglycerol:prolipoprotein diacylglycerol transferase [Berkelbacteria bacterium GW2011_GWE1_39_12]